MKLNDLDLNKLHVFRVVAEARSMRAASAVLLRTPSAVSQSVSGLERELGMQLFRRVGVRLELTEAGRAVLQQVRSQEEGLLRVLGSLRGRAGEVRGLVTLGLPLGYPASALGEALTRALEPHPGLQLRLRFLNHAELAHALRRGQLDLALSLQPLRERAHRLHSQEIRKEHVVLALPPGWRLLAQETRVLRVPVVDYFQKPLLIESWFRHHRLDLRRQDPQVRAFGATLDHVLEFLRRGLGAAVVPRDSVREELERGTLLEHVLDRRRPWLNGVWLNSYLPEAKLAEGARVFWRELSR